MGIYSEGESRTVGERVLGEKIAVIKDKKGRSLREVEFETLRE